LVNLGGAFLRNQKMKKINLKSPWFFTILFVLMFSGLTVLIQGKSHVASSLSSLLFFLIMLGPGYYLVQSTLINIRLYRIRNFIMSGISILVLVTIAFTMSLIKAHRIPVEIWWISGGAAGVLFMMAAFFHFLLYFQFKKLKQLTPVAEDAQKPVSVGIKITQSLEIIFAGRMLILEDKLLFISKEAKRWEIAYDQIRECQVPQIGLFQTRMTMTLANGDQFDIHLPFPAFWAKQILKQHATLTTN
jgi:hypothetical protein